MQPLEYFQAQSDYTVLPLRFEEFDDRSHILTNFAGQYLLVDREPLSDLIHHNLELHSPLYDLFKSRLFLMDDESSVALDLLSSQYRTRHSLLPHLTGLFMLVTTLRCNNECTYCQVSHKDCDSLQYDMTTSVADQALQFIAACPSPEIKIEFQGGESLLNFDVVKHVVDHAKCWTHKSVEFVLTTNLINLDDEHLSFCSANDIYISTSLDGPEELHNANRPNPSRNNHAAVTRNIERVRDRMGDTISALMTTTRRSLEMPREIVDEYVRLGFSSIFLRLINPYGFALEAKTECGYAIDQWLEFYSEALDYILELNLNGQPFVEEFAAVFLRKILTPYPMGFVDLQSPAGLGIAGIVVNHNGDIYLSDEGRMLGEMGDHTFRTGNVATHSHQDIMGSNKLHSLLGETMTECMPMCSECAYQPFCGSDPVRHYVSQGDQIGFKPTSEFCKKNKGILRKLITILEGGGPAAEVLRSWV